MCESDSNPSEPLPDCRLVNFRHTEGVIDWGGFVEALHAHRDADQETLDRVGAEYIDRCLEPGRAERVLEITIDPPPGPSQ
jgi:hypothetical protein